MIPNTVLNFLKNTLHLIKPSIPLEIPIQDDFKNVWGLDSLDLMEFVARIEQQFQLLIPDEDLEKMINMEAVANYLDERVNLLSVE